MKKIILGMSLLIVFLLAACTVGSTPPVIQETPTISSDDLQTQIAQMLTQLPTDAVALDTSPTPELPTVVVQETAVGEATTPPVEGVSTATPVPSITNTPAPELPTATQTQVPPTATQAPTSTPTQPAGPTSTPPPSDPRTRLGAPSSTDPMNDEFTWVWPTGSDTYTTASFSNGYQTITALTETDGWRMSNPENLALTNLYLEGTIRTTTCSGSDHYGLIVRVPELSKPDQGYLFGVTCDGRYSLRRWNSEIGTKGEMKRLIDWTASSAIKTGSNQVNRLGMYAYNNRLILYVNGVLLGEVSDSTFTSGYFGVHLGSDVTQGLTIQVDEMSYWKNAVP